MSFLLSLLCCGSVNEDDRNKREVQRRTLTPTQTQIQKALVNKGENSDNQKKNAKDVKSQDYKKPQAEVSDAKESSVDSNEDEDETISNEPNPVPKPDDQISQQQKLELSNNPIAGISSDQDIPQFDEERLLEEDIDLTRIQTDQAVSSSGWLLEKQPESLRGRKTLILDLDETLVHSSFKYVRQSDFVIPVEIDNQAHNVFVIKRPGVDKFLEKCGQLFEVVVFTASVSRYGDPLLDVLDRSKAIHHRLFRESCFNYQGNYIKNLSQIGRPLNDLIIIDNSPASYIFHPQHSVPISSWFSDTHDNELSDLLPFLEDLSKQSVSDVALVLDVSL